MSKTAITAAPIAPVLADRWSPRAYDASYEIASHDLLSVLEAGRWAPSANNMQPWFFSVAKRGDDLWNQINAEALEGFNAAWAAGQDRDAAEIRRLALTVTQTAAAAS